MCANCDARIRRRDIKKRQRWVLAADNRLIDLNIRRQMRPGDKRDTKLKRCQPDSRPDAATARTPPGGGRGGGDGPVAMGRWSGGWWSGGGRVVSDGEVYPQFGSAGG